MPVRVLCALGSVRCHPWIRVTPAVDYSCDYEIFLLILADIRVQMAQGGAGDWF